MVKMGWRDVLSKFGDSSGTESIGKRTLLRHSVYYLFAAGVPGLVSFFSVAIYSRLLPPSEYGIFALVIANTLLVQSVAYRWITNSVTRFLPAQREQPRELLESILITYLMVCGLTGALGSGIYFWISDLHVRRLILLGILLLWATTWFDLNLEAARSSFQPARYAWMSITRSVSTILIGVPLVLLGLGAYGLLVGHFVSALLAATPSTLTLWRQVRLRWHAGMVRRTLRYGLPLTADAIVRYVVTTSDRLIIGHFLGASAAGLYAVGYDLGWRLLNLLFSSIELAVTPLVFRAFEQQDRSRALTFLAQVRTLIWAVSAPVAAVLIAVPRPLVEMVLGVRFRETAMEIIPWIAIAYLFLVIMNFYNYAFRLGLRTELQVVVMALGAGVNLMTNFLLIPRIGLLGAAIATTAAFGAAALLSYILSQRILPMRIPIHDIAKITLASAMTAGVLRVLPLAHGLWGVIQMFLLGSTLYLAFLWVLNPAQLRSYAHRLLNTIRRQEPC